MPTIDPRQAVKPLRHVFWGGLLWILDFSCSSVSGGTGIQLDLLNDLIGAFMILWGIHRLCEMPISGRYARHMGFVRRVAQVSVLVALLDFFVFPEPWLLTLLLNVYGIAVLVAIVLFCRSMQSLCRAFGLAGAARMWQTTFTACLIVYCLPLGVMYVWSSVMLLAGEESTLDLGPVFFVFVPLFIAPMILLFAATSRMAREAEALPPETTPHLSATEELDTGWNAYLVLAVLLVVGGGILGGLVMSPGMPLAGRRTAACMCSMGFSPLPNAQQQQRLENYLQSQEFILTILKRDPKYAELIPEAGNFWHPTYVDGRFENNNVPTNFGESYQPLFMDLRLDIYAEVDYQMGIVQLASQDPRELRRAFASLDTAKQQNPRVDLVAPLEEALADAPNGECRAYLAAALEAAKTDRRLEGTYHNTRAARDEWP